jgi:hypothetical protein
MDVALLHTAADWIFPRNFFSEAAGKISTNPKIMLFFPCCGIIQLNCAFSTV